MRVNDRLKMEFMAECLGKRPAFLMQERPWSPSLSTNLPLRHSAHLKILALVRRPIAIRSSSGLSRFRELAIGRASDQAAVWLFCAVNSRQWFPRSGRTTIGSMAETGLRRNGGQGLHVGLAGMLVTNCRFQKSHCFFFPCLFLLRRRTPQVLLCT